jgi:diphosphomevalonate decarboxylase
MVLKSSQTIKQAQRFSIEIYAPKGYIQTMTWKASAPSNIALIKYMGKLDFAKNIPSNSSLSYTLQNLKTFVEIERTEGAEDQWKPLVQSGCLSPIFSIQGQKRFLTYFKKLKDVFHVQENFIIKSANNFPSDSGLASSASSFAALTMAASDAFESLGYKNHSDQTLYQLSREGSGSSCRSFFSPWAVWKGTEVFKPEIKIQKLLHDVVLVDTKLKEVSSGEAHKRIETSPHNKGRAERAEKRLMDLISAFNEDNWKAAYNIVWDEFMDMHELFETSEPLFCYRTEKSYAALQILRKFWKDQEDGPLVTMDAGPNIHLLWREDQQHLREELQTTFSKVGNDKDFSFLT